MKRKSDGKNQNYGRNYGFIAMAKNETQIAIKRNCNEQKNCEEQKMLWQKCKTRMTLQWPEREAENAVKCDNKKRNCDDCIVKQR